MKAPSPFETNPCTPEKQTAQSPRKKHAVTNQVQGHPLSAISEKSRIRLDQEIDELFRKFDDLHKSLVNK